MCLDWLLPVLRSSDLGFLTILDLKTDTTFNRDTGLAMLGR